MLDTLQPPATHRLVVERVRRAIHLGEYASGDRLPAERDLAGHLGVSRATVREAMIALQVLGYVESRRGKAGGWFVRAPEPGRVPMRELALAALPDLEEALDFRIVVEGGAARLAAGRRADDDLRALHDAVVAMRRHLDLPGFRRADTAFHLAVAIASRNRRVYEAVEEARVTMFRVVDLLEFAVVRETSLQAHQRILAAIEGRDEPGAERAAVAHIETTRRELYAVLKEDRDAF